MISYSGTTLRQCCVRQTLLAKLITKRTFLDKRPIGYERVQLPLCKVEDTPFHIQGDDKLFMGVS